MSYYFTILGIDECAEQPCQNNGTCVDLMNDYTCNCMDGFNGTDCTNSKLRVGMQCPSSI